MDEKDLATQQAQAGQDPRLPGEDEEQKRAESPEAQAAEGPEPPHRMTQGGGQGPLGFSKRGPGVSAPEEGSFRPGPVGFRPLAPPHGRGGVGIVVSKKVGKAVVRNKVRRRIREILKRLHLPPADLLVIAQPEAREAGFVELARDLFLALKRSGLVQ